MKDELKKPAWITLSKEERQKFTRREAEELERLRKQDIPGPQLDLFGAKKN